MFIHLFFLCSNVALQLAEDLHIGESTAYVLPQGPDNIIEEAVKVLQIEYIDRMKLEIDNLHLQNEKKSQEILKMEQKDRTSSALIEKMKLDHEAEITRMKEKFDEEIGGIKEEHEKEVIKLKSIILENETKCARKLSAKDTLTQYIMNVLKDSDSLIKFWQNIVKSQAHEISKLEKYHEMEKILIKKQNIIETQSENIKDLEEIIANSNNLTESYEKLEKLDPSKSNCEIPPWMTTLTEALASQRKEIKTLTGYFEDKKEVEEQMLTLANIIGKTNMTITESMDTIKLSRNFEETMDKQSNSLNLLRDLLSNSSCGIVYEEDDHRTISATPCSCIPTPPQDTGLQLTMIQYDCKDTKNSGYKIQCQDDHCITDAWPSCSTDDSEDDDSSDDLPWTYNNCRKVDIPYLNISVGCGTSEGWKARVTTINVGQGVFQKTRLHVPCMDCDEQTFQWTQWKTQGNKLVRTRGVQSIPNSFQQEEKVSNVTVNRFSSISGSWNVGDGKVDSIDFVPSKSIAIRGISLHRSNSGTNSFTGLIRLKEASTKTVIATQNFAFTTDNSMTYFDQLFSTPTNVKAGLKYTISLHYDGTYGATDIWKGDGGQDTVFANCGEDSVKFQFTSSTDFDGEGSNSSSKNSGQIPRILISC